MNSLPKFTFGQVGVGSNIAQNHSHRFKKVTLVFFAPVVKKRLPKLK